MHKADPLSLVAEVQRQTRVLAPSIASSLSNRVKRAMSTNASAVWSSTTAHWSATPTATVSSTSSATSSYGADWATQYEDTDGWYTGPWSHYDQDDRNFNASDYSGGTASVCTTSGGQTAGGDDNCEVRVSFTGACGLPAQLFKSFSSSC